MADEDWRGTKSAAQCLEDLCMSERCSDIIFAFSNNTVKLHAHRFILSMRSAVFEAMFYGPMSGSNEEIVITDCDPEAFKTLLKYLYTDNVQLNGASVSSCLYLARKYCVDRLVLECSRFLHTSISCDSACTMYEQSVRYDMQDLQQTCMNYMIDHDRDILESDDLFNLSRDTFKVFLASDELSSDEHDIFDACVRWARNRLVRDEEEITTESVRKCLGDVFYNIRFPLMQIERFARSVSPFGLLRAEEEVEIYRYLATAKSDDNAAVETVGRFTSRPRLGRTLEVVLEKRQEKAPRFLVRPTHTIILAVDTPVAITVRSVKGNILKQVEAVQLQCFKKDAEGFLGFNFGNESSSLKFEHKLSNESWTLKEGELEFSEMMDLPPGVSHISFNLAPNYYVSEIGRFDEDIRVKDTNVKLSYSTYITGFIDAIVFSK